MKRELGPLLFLLSFVVAAAGACDAGEAACKVDRDCPQGTICREEKCGPVGADASAPAPDATPACTNDGLACDAPEDCCSRACSAGRCTSATPAPTTSTCRGIYELCQNDCCSGLTCTAGACR